MNEKLKEICKFFKEKWLGSACDFICQNWHMVLALVFLVVSIIVHAWGVVIAAMGGVLLSLKYKLDKANYHKDLFEKRYEIYSIANKAHWYWASHRNINREIYGSISDDFMGRACYLFDKETFEFIVKLRSNLLKFYNGSENQGADTWLSYWVDHPDEFRAKFKGLSISI